MRPAQLQAVLDREFMSARVGHHTPVMLWGPPGVGKSQIIAGVATRHNVKMIDIRLSQMEPSDLRGIPFRIDNLVEWAIPSMLPDVERRCPILANLDCAPIGLLYSTRELIAAFVSLALRERGGGEGISETQ